MNDNTAYRLATLIGHPTDTPTGSEREPGCIPTFFDARTVLRRPTFLPNIPSFPVYTIRKQCPECDLTFMGNSPLWQRDDEPNRVHRCDTCIGVWEAHERQRKAQEQAEWDQRMGTLPTPRRRLPPRRPGS